MLIESLFYPRQHVEANRQFDINGPMDGTQLQVGFSCPGKPNQEGRMPASLTLSVDLENSNNHPYNFELEVFGMAEGPGIPENSTDARAIMFQILVGAARERLAELTGRGPWSPFLLGIINPPTDDLS